MQFENLLPRIDFLSVGSNDLVQFLFASDRGNPRLEGRYDVLAPAVLNFLKKIADSCRDSGTQLTVCGEMAGDPVAAMALLGLGYERLSMSAVGVGPVKAMVRSLSLKRPCRVSGASAAFECAKHTSATFGALRVIMGWRSK